LQGCSSVRLNDRPAEAEAFCQDDQGGLLPSNVGQSVSQCTSTAATTGALAAIKTALTSCMSFRYTTQGGVPLTLTIDRRDPVPNTRDGFWLRLAASAELGDILEVLAFIHTGAFISHIVCGATIDNFDMNLCEDIRRVPPEQTGRVSLLIGTASFRPQLGYALPPGDWGVQALLRVVPDTRGPDRPMVILPPDSSHQPMPVPPDTHGPDQRTPHPAADDHRLNRWAVPASCLALIQGSVRASVADGQANGRSVHWLDEVG
jgi:hypothetical protein